MPPQDPALPPVLAGASQLTGRVFAEIDYRECVICRSLFIGRPTDNGHRKTCSTKCAAKHRRELSNSRKRNREHAERTAVSDITPAQELEMRHRARKCPMPGCGVKLTDQPGLPNSKHLDHIVPLNPTAGGTHTLGNVRIICARCNLKRPKDGSDYTGQVTLWAVTPGTVTRPHGGTNRTTCRKGLHPWVPDSILIVAGKKRCAACRQAQVSAAAQRQNERRRKPPARCRCGALFAAPGNTLMCPDCKTAAVRKAMDLHLADSLGWAEIAEQVGYGSAWGIAYAVKRAMTTAV